MAGEILKAEEVLKVGQRLEIFLDGREEHFRSRIEDIKPDVMIVAMPFDNQRVPVIPATGESFYGLAADKASRYRFCTKGRGTSREGQVPVWRITKPTECEKFQDRAFVRVRVKLHVKVRLVDEEGCIAEPVVAPVIDLSGNGIGFVWPKEVKVGTQVGLEINEIPNVGALEIMSQVVRCTAVKRGENDYIYHIGASFQHLSRAIANKIVHYVFTVQREVIAKGIGKD